VDFSPSSGDHDPVVAVGLQLRGLWLPTWLPPRFGLGAGLSAFLPTTFRAGPADVRLTRGVLDLSAHYSVPLGALRLTPALGPAIELHDVRGTSADGAGELRALFALRGGFETALLLTRSFGLALDLSALFLPVTGDLALHQAGVVGKEPSLYLGLGVGFVFLP
jgi:hypothetical protein